MKFLICAQESAIGYEGMYVNGHVSSTINRMSHRLTRLDLLLHTQNIPIGNIFKSWIILEECPHLILTLRGIVFFLFSCNCTRSPHALPSHHSTEKSCLIRFRVTFFISASSAQSLLKQKCVLSIDLSTDLGIERTMAQ